MGNDWCLCGGYGQEITKKEINEISLQQKENNNNKKENSIKEIPEQIDKFTIEVNKNPENKKEKELDEREENLKKNEQDLIEREQKFENDIQLIQEELNNREQDLNEKEKEKEKDLNEKENNLLKFQEELNVLDKKLNDENKRLKEENKKLNDEKKKQKLILTNQQEEIKKEKEKNEKIFKEKEANFQIKYNNIISRENAVKKSEKNIKEKEVNFQKKYNNIISRENALKENEKNINDKQNDLLEKEKNIEKLLENKEKGLKLKIDKKENELKNKEKELIEQNQKLIDKQKELDLINNQEKIKMREKEKDLELRIKELDKKIKDFEERAKEFEEKSKEFEAKKKELDKNLKDSRNSKNQELNKKMKEFEEKEKNLIKKENELTEKENKIKLIESKRKLSESQIKQKYEIFELEKKKFKEEKEKINSQLIEREKVIKLKEDELLESKKPILIGLNNIGATCYMNATLQCLSNTNKLTEYFLNIYKTSPNKNMSNEYQKVLINIWDRKNNNKSYSPNSFKEVLSKENPLFAGIAANDSKDLINFLLERFHQELNIEKPNKNINNNMIAQEDQTNENMMLKLFLEEFQIKFNSPISNLFYGILETKSQCLGCKIIKFNFQVYSFLEFPLQQVNEFFYNQGKKPLFTSNGQNPEINLYECFEYYVKVDLMNGENQMYCNLCNKLFDSYYSTVIYSTPIYLIINLNRGKGATYKCKVNFPEQLNLFNNVTFKDGYTAYGLYAVICHLGPSSMSGHFVAYCRNRKDNKWYLYNDAFVNPCTKPQQYNDGMPYILFYKALTLD